MSKYEDKVKATIGFVEDSDEHPEVTLAMFRTELVRAEWKVREALDRVGLWGASAGMLARLDGAVSEVLILAHGLAALVEKTMGPYDEDTWRDWLRDLAESTEETEAILADPETMAAIAEAEAEGYDSTPPTNGGCYDEPEPGCGWR